jgi:uncharacterized phage-associated protein
MAYSAMAVANAFIKRAQEGKLRDLTPMKLQKLLFFAQSWCLAKEQEPLMDDVFCRWQYGPVIPSLYHEFKEYGARPIAALGGHLVERDGKLLKVTPYVGDDDEESWALVDEIIRVYGDYSGAQLSYITHQEDSAWFRTGGADGGPMQNEELAQYIHQDPHFAFEAAR